MTNLKTAKQIEAELTQLERGDHLHWGAVFLLLDSIEQSGCWQGEADSFTNWIDKNAVRFHVKPATLWRIFAAGRFVHQGRDRIIAKGANLPPIEEMADAVSPESVELLSKIERAIPDEKFAEIANKVFSGNCKRSELREIWQTYRPILKGKTARGRGVTAPRLDQKDPEQFNSLMEANAIRSIIADGYRWTGISEPEQYQLFPHISPENFQESSSSSMFSAVAVVKPNHGKIQFYGLLFQAAFDFAKTYFLFNDYISYCDRFWLVIRSDAKRTCQSIVEDPDFNPAIGIIVVTDEIIQVHKNAESVSSSGINRGELAIAILIRTLGTK